MTYNRLIVILILILGLSACRLRSATASSATSTKNGTTEFRGYGVCKLQGNLPESLAFSEIQITLPYAPAGLTQSEVTKNTVRIRFDGADHLAIDEGLDLYDRAGHIALVSGALVDAAPSYELKYSFKMTLSPDTQSQSGYVAIDGQFGQTNLPVTCRWEKRSDLNIAEIENGGVDTITLNPNPEGEGTGFQLASAQIPPLACK